MFDIDNNSVIYNDWLKPDEGYELHFGVCCTYSLDLEAVAGTMLALGPPFLNHSNILSKVMDYHPYSSLGETR